MKANKHEGKCWFKIRVNGRVVDCVPATSHDEAFEYATERWLPNAVRAYKEMADIEIVPVPIAPRISQIDLDGCVYDLLASIGPADPWTPMNCRCYLKPIVTKDEEK